MRLTPFAIFDQLTRSLNNAMEQYSVANARLATGKRIQKPSDDVNGTMRAMDYRLNIGENEQFGRNLEFTSARFNTMVSSFQAISSTAAEAKRLLVLSISGSSDPAVTSSLSQAAAVLRDSLATFAETKYMDQYIFSGFLSDTAPYLATAPAIGDAVTVYDGSAAAGVAAATVTNPALLTGDAYRIGFDAAGANYTVTNAATGAVVTPATAYNAGGTTVTLPGMSIIIAGGPVGAADSFVVQPPLTRYAYQGDAGVMNVQIDRGAVLPVNMPGSDTFSYTLPGPSSTTISGGRFVHYTPGAGTRIDVEIRDTNDVTVLDTFSFSNIMEMTNLLSSAIGTNNAARLEALQDPFNKYLLQIGTVQADIGARQIRLNDQKKMLTSSTNTFYESLSTIEEADMLETAAILKKTEVTLQSLRESASKVMSQSLLDFLR